VGADPVFVGDRLDFTLFLWEQNLFLWEIALFLWEQNLFLWEMSFATN
jgi:hypothetical protein